MVPELGRQADRPRLRGAGRARRRRPGATSTTSCTSRPARPSPTTRSSRPTSCSRCNALAQLPAPGCCATAPPPSPSCRSNAAHDLVTDLRDLGVTSFAMELVPRISRAQSMDALSSQALVAGYRCAIVAAGLLRRFFPLNMTAAGTVQPAQVVVLGAGVAGLQAIATAKRLGAVVKAYDVRAAAAEEIRSMGAEGDRPRARDARGRRWLRPRDDRGPGRAAARAAGAVHRRRGRADHHRRRARPHGADAGHRRDGRADEARARWWSTWPPRSGGNVEGSVRRQGRADRRTRRSGAATTCPAQMPGPASQALRAERRQPGHPDDQRGRVRPGLRRRDRRRRRASPTPAGSCTSRPARRSRARPSRRRSRARSSPSETTHRDEQLDLPFDQEADSERGQSSG